MAKGNIFMGTVKGRIGDTVLYVSGGQQNITKYQPNITNPQTGRQMYQRARFANAGRFFTRGQQNFYKFAFENKKPGVSDFNAFMQANINRSVLISKSALAVEGYPAIGKFIMSRGSLSSVSCRVVNDYWQAHFGIAEQSTNPTTIGELTSLLIATGSYLNGDILTFVFLNTTGSGYIPSAKPSGEYHTEWIIKQFKLRLGDPTPLADYEMRAVRRVWGNVAYMTLTDLEDSQILYSTDSAFTVVHSRNTPGGLKVSTQELALGETMEIAYDECQTDEYKEQVIADWKSVDNVNYAPEAILEGNITWQPSDYNNISISLGDDSPFTLDDWRLDGIGRIISGEGYIAAIFRGNGITAENFRAVCVECPAENEITFNNDGDGVVEMGLVSTGEDIGTNIYRIQYYSDGDWHSVAHMEFSFGTEMTISIENGNQTQNINAGGFSDYSTIIISNDVPMVDGDVIKVDLRVNRQSPTGYRYIKPASVVFGTGDDEISWANNNYDMFGDNSFIATGGYLEFDNNKFTGIVFSVKNNTSSAQIFTFNVQYIDIYHKDGSLTRLNIA